MTALDEIAWSGRSGTNSAAVDSVARMLTQALATVARNRAEQQGREPEGPRP